MRETIPAALHGERVDRVVALLADRTRSAVADLVDRGAVRVDGRVVTTRAQRVVEGEVLEVDLPQVFEDVRPRAEPEVDVVVLHEDEDLVVVDKPAGLVVHPGAGHEHGTLVNGLLARYPELAEVGQPDRPGIVHRLDRGTSGLLAVARTPAAYDQLVRELQERRVVRRYQALVRGRVEAAEGVVDAPIGRSPRHPTRMAVVAGGREARTRYRVLRRFEEPVAATLLECTLETGRTHQIRVHLAAIGHPVVGDDTYGGTTDRLPLARPWLHATVLELAQPRTGAPVRVVSSPPEDLVRVLDRLV